MRSKFWAALIAVVVLVGITPGTASAAPQRDVYVSLGTSLAAGTMADELGNNILFTNRSYTDKLAIQVSASEHVKLGCPGETVSTMINGGICYTNGTSQLSLATARLAAGDVDLVTIDLGANDFLEATPAIQACGENFPCVYAILSGIASGIGGVLDELQAADPDVQIVGMNYYNPNLAAWVGYYSGIPGQFPPNPTFAFTSNVLATVGNDLIEAQFSARGILVADVEAEFDGTEFEDSNSNGLPNNVEKICELTSMCPANPLAAPNIHATKEGYGRIAYALKRAITEAE